jgi:hypothetical protein
VGGGCVRPQLPREWAGGAAGRGSRPHQYWRANVVTVRRATFNREYGESHVRWYVCTATLQAAKAIEACLAHQDLDGALVNMCVTDAVMVLLTDKPERGERVH